MSLTLILLVACHLSGLGKAQAEDIDTNVLTQHYNNQRTGATLNENILTPTKVNVDHFGKLFSRKVDGEIYAQPLYVARVVIPGKGAHNVIYVATEHDSVYCFDADNPRAATPYWKTSFINDLAKIRPVLTSEVGTACGTYRDMSKEIGITGTPVIDTQRGTLYVVAMTSESDKIVQRLHALDITTGKEKLGSPVEITASVKGKGAGSKDGKIAFDPAIHNQRPGLLLVNNVVYIAWASFCDTGPYHGWIIGYDADNLRQVTVFNTTPEGQWAGIWQSGRGLVSDDAHNIYFETGNGTYSDGQNFGNSVVRLQTDSKGRLFLTDWFTPTNQDMLNQYDADLGVSGPLLIPGTNLIVGGSKEGKLYVMDTNDLGQFNSLDDNQIVQWWQAANGHIHGSPIYWESPAGRLLYVWSEGDRLKSFKLNNTDTFDILPFAKGSLSLPGGDMPGGILSLSASGNTAGTGIVWATTALGNANQSVRPGIFHAYDAVSLKELWNSEEDLFRDRVGKFAKFCPPTIANGKVYLATFSNRLSVYGILPQEPPALSYTSNSGGGTLGRFSLDNHSNGGDTDITNAAIDISGVTNPAPMKVYQSWRMGDDNTIYDIGEGDDAIHVTFNYVFPNLATKPVYKVRLHFTEPIWPVAGRRQFHVIINGTQVLTNFDIFKAAGGKNKAIVKEFTTKVDARKRIIVEFIYGKAGNPLVCGIEVIPSIK